MELHLPKPYLSYSQISLWSKDKQAYREKYYEGIEPATSSYALFGKEIHELIEHGDERLMHVPRYDTPEYRIACRIDGVPVLGVLDSFDSQTYRFLDYKSGIRKNDGAVRWTHAEVQKLDQLPLYSLLVKTKHDRTHAWTSLVWLETAWEEYEEFEVFDGHRLATQKRRLALTGHTETFHRRIAQWERDRMRDILVTTAKEISSDYSLYEKK